MKVCGLEFDRKDIRMNKLVATTLESTFHVFDTTTQHPKKGFACLTEKVSVFNIEFIFMVVFNLSFLIFIHYTIQ